MKYATIMICLFLGMPGCSLHRERNGSEKYDWVKSGNDSERHAFFEDKFIKTRGRAVLYEDSYIGNFTLYYTPDVVDPSKVLVPQVTCYSADLDLDEASVKPYPVMRCSYYEVIRYYAGQPEYFYEIAGGGVNRLLAYRVALAWYTRSDKGAHIKTISWKKGALSIFSSGGACSTGETVEFGPNQEIIFKEQDVVICS